jgi:hypothetical protein
VRVAPDTSGASNPWDASHTDYATVKFPKWRTAYELAKSGVKITQLDGKDVRSTGPLGDEEFERPFFSACVAVLREADEDGTLEPLPRAAGFELGVEATLGGDGEVWKPGGRTGKKGRGSTA